MTIPRYIDSLLVDGVDLEGMGLLVTDYSGLFAPGNRRGDDDVIPGRRGQIGAELPYDAYTFTIPVAFTTAKELGLPTNVSRGYALEALHNVGLYLAGNNGLVTLTRRLSSNTGYDGLVTHTAAGRYVAGTAVQFLNPYNWTTELQFINLDGGWFDGTNWLVP